MVRPSGTWRRPCHTSEGTVARLVGPGHFCGTTAAVVGTHSGGAHRDRPPCLQHAPGTGGPGSHQARPEGVDDRRPRARACVLRTG
jgi:hypothetical protein